MLHTIFTLDQRPDLETQLPPLHCEGWPAFLRKDAVAERFWSLLFTDFADFQIAVCDETDRVIAVGNAIPVVWDGTVGGLPDGWDAVLEQGVNDREQRREPTSLSALGIVVAKDRRRQGLSSVVIQKMKSIAAEHGLASLIAPVRPTLKSSYPLTPMERYVTWQREDGAPFDPWIRVHWRLGAEYMCVAHRSMVIEGTVADWETWTKMRFPESGAYIVPQALQPVVIDCERDEGRYVEANVWMRYRMREA